MNVTGTNTASRTSVVAITGPVIWPIALRVASRGSSPSSAIRRSTFSTTTIASSTTIPMASTSAKSETVFSDIPSISRKANVPISETGMATAGMIVARQLPRNTNTTDTTRIKVRISVEITSDSDCSTKRVLSNGML